MLKTLPNPSHVTGLFLYKRFSLFGKYRKRPVPRSGLNITSLVKTSQNSATQDLLTLTVLVLAVRSFPRPQCFIINAGTSEDSLSSMVSRHCNNWRKQNKCIFYVSKDENVVFNIMVTDSRTQSSFGYTLFL